MATTLSKLIADIEREEDAAEARRTRRARKVRLVLVSTRAARRDLTAARLARRAQA